MTTDKITIGTLEFDLLDLPEPTFGKSGFVRWNMPLEPAYSADDMRAFALDSVRRAVEQMVDSGAFVGWPRP